MVRVKFNDAVNTSGVVLTAEWNCTAGIDPQDDNIAFMIGSYRMHLRLGPC